LCKTEYECFVSILQYSKNKFSFYFLFGNMLLCSIYFVKFPCRCATHLAPYKFSFHLNFIIIFRLFLCKNIREIFIYKKYKEKIISLLENNNKDNFLWYFTFCLWFPLLVVLFLYIQIIYFVINRSLFFFDIFTQKKLILSKLLILVKLSSD
jgi:hypothetical protein